MKLTRTPYLIAFFKILFVHILREKKTENLQPRK